MQEILKCLPSGRRDKAHELRAMRRDRGAIRSPESLFRLNMLYVTNGGSFQMAATGMSLTENMSMVCIGLVKQ